MIATSFGGWSIDVELFEYIQKLVPPGGTILELGSGTSTEELSKLYNVISIEHDEKFVGLYNSTYIHAPLRNIKPHKHFSQCTEWYDADIIKKELEGKSYDLLLVDGPIGANTTRPAMYKYRDLFNWNVPVIFDDSGEPHLWQMIVTLCQYLKKSNLITVNADKRKCFTVLI